MSLSIIGCVVNGPGEAKLADIGITGGGKNQHKIYISGKTSRNISTEKMIKHIVKLVEDRAAFISRSKKNTF